MAEQINIQYYKSPIGELILGSYNNQLCVCDWKYRKKREAIDKRIQKGLDGIYFEISSNIIERTKQQLNEYFEGTRTSFDIPLLLVGSNFQKTVWNTLLQIPFGKTDTYLNLSNTLENPKAIRAVATANGANAIAILIPCHRIIGSDGDLVGYAGGIPSKKTLLELEGALNNNQLKLF